MIFYPKYKTPGIKVPGVLYLLKFVKKNFGRYVLILELGIMAELCVRHAP